AEKPSPTPSHQEPSAGQNSSFSIETGKRQVAQSLAAACNLIKDNKKHFKRERISKATQYFTPRFPTLSGQYRRFCYNIEGSCLVGNTLHNYGMRPQNITRTQCKFGFGNGS